MPNGFSATELYAFAQGVACEGKDKCHWCGASCTQKWRHDDPPPTVGVRNRLARCPANHFVCAGCWMFRRKRVTVHFLSGGFVDARPPDTFGWIVTSDAALAVRDVRDKTRLLDRRDTRALYERLLRPTTTFALSLLSTDEKNHLHLAPVNESASVRADTPLKFHLDNKPLEYNVYELEEALKNGATGKSPGVRALVDLLGEHPIAKTGADVGPRPRGRPSKDESSVTNPSTRLISQSSLEASSLRRRD